jgi:hypothetical protein
MTAPVRLNDAENQVLAALASVANPDFGFLSFAAIGRRVSLDRPVIRRACRSLTRKGLAKFSRGLWTDDGDMAGSGYAATAAGCERADPALAETMQRGRDRW